MRRLRFDAVKAGYVLEYKGEQYIKLAKAVKSGGLVHSWNAVTKDGGLFNFYPYEEVSEIGPFTKEKK